MDAAYVALQIILSITNALARAKAEKRDLTPAELVAASQLHDNEARSVLQTAIDAAKSKQASGG